MNTFRTFWEDFITLHEKAEPTPFKGAAQQGYKRLRFDNDIYTTKGGIKNKKSGAPFTGKMKRAGTDRLRFEESTEPESVDLSTFIVHDKLDRKVWNSEDKIDPAVRDRLLQIAEDFYNKLKIKAEIHDITLTGSLANYNWSKYSDLDVHIILDYEDIDENLDLVRELFQETKSNWNRKHDIMVKNYEVELYVQDVNDPHFSSGVYSLLNDEWVVKPRREEKEIDRAAIQKKAASTMDMVDDVQRLFDEGKFDEAIKYGEKVRNKIKKFRSSGLEREGEYSFENLAFKVLRRNDYLTRLSKLRVDAYDSQMSMTQ
jgi:predicted nucleotidyltransferase